MSKLDQRLIGYITLFENLTRAKVKDAFLDREDRVVFVVNEGDAGKAIGKNGNNIKRISKMIKRNIKVIEYSSDVVDFIKSAINPIIADSIEIENNIVTIRSKDLHTKSILIGRDKRNINNLNNLVKKYFKDIEVKVS